MNRAIFFEAKSAVVVLSLSMLLLGPSFVRPADSQVDADIFTVVKKPPQPGKRITPFLRYQVEMGWRQDELRKARLRAVRDETELLELQRELRRDLLEDIGGLPEEKTPLNPVITGTLQLEGYRIEKLIFESLPGFKVTALVYVPDGLKKPAPAVIVTCGHSPLAKAFRNYQQISGRLAKRGYVVLCLDPIGQGERSQCWDAGRGESRYNLVCGEHAIIGDLAYIAGASLTRWMVWDGIRAVDYLLTRPEVDGSRISITGTSGGGYQSSHIAALDTRIHAAAPSCYICSLPMRMYNRIFADPDNDSEQDNYRMLSDGIDHAGLLLLIYPRPVVISAAVEDFFPIEGTRETFRQVEAVYRRFGHPERIALTEGYHPHSFSNYNQEFALAFLDRFNNMPVKYDLDSTRILEEKDLWCTKSGQVTLDFPQSRTIFQLIRDYAAEMKKQGPRSLAAEYRGSLYPGIDTWKVTPWQAVPAENEIGVEETGSSELEGYQVSRIVLHHSAMLSLPLLHIFKRNRPADKTLLWIGNRGKLSSADWPTVKKYLDQGYEVVSFDFRGQGEDKLLYTVVSIDDPRLAKVELDRQYYSPLSGVLINYVVNTLLTGRPYFLQMIEDAEIAARYVSLQLGAKKILVSGPGEANRIAGSIAEALPEVELLPSDSPDKVDWSGIVESMREEWPVEYVLPGGVAIH
ncbi:MAG: hypothetical protein A3F83_12260 [Candidatus Glassbacteria bacterium RIFCSPLOWO2_12_FULL_58_11]|uniref:Acetyl xylan esterase domain-containing protein n=1 Tax=Candidatus Glassbacteria bacterium RIFCSPLOWO2_12_FULL_58_11 TaxID=1817867 RepID=A0A1F5Z321_9BACT|nr:MAG: hypothetical protein A3F83_12260 [Candidatus Glassbacteria bacterium RIFCSPLOWO2_12_FULL_58_11]